MTLILGFSNMQVQPLSPAPLLIEMYYQQAISDIGRWFESEARWIFTERDAVSILKLCEERDRRIDWAKETKARRYELYRQQQEEKAKEIARQRRRIRLARSGEPLPPWDGAFDNVFEVLTDDAKTNRL